MSTEQQGGDPRRDIVLPHEVQLGVSFRPYQDIRRFCLPGEGNKPYLVPEPYRYFLAVRREVSLFGMKGCIDIISENPSNQWAPVTNIAKRGGFSQPLGIAMFETVYGKEGEKITAYPFILRFSFLFQTPAEYAKLIDTYIDAQLGKKQYSLGWAISRPEIRRNMQRLEVGEKVLVAKRNLIDQDILKMIQGMTNGDQVVEEEVDVEETGESFVWLPKDLEKFRTIKVTFQRYSDDDDDQQIEPIEPERDRVPVLI